MSFVMKYCPTSNVVRNPASVQNLITRFCCDSLSTRSWYFCNRSSCAGSFVEGVDVVIHELVDTNNGSDCPIKTELPVLTWQDLYSSRKSETASWILSWLTELIVRKTASIVPSSAQKCIDNFPPSLLLSTPRDNELVNRKTGFPLSLNVIIITSATLSHSPFDLLSWVEYHFFSDPCPRNTYFPVENLFAYIETSWALNSYSRSFSLDPHEMSLNIDI